MAANAPEVYISVQGQRARSRPAELPRCDGLRACAAAIALAQYLMATRLLESVNLEPGVRAGFALSGFLLASFLLRERGRAVDEGQGSGPLGEGAWGRALIQALPVASLIAPIVAVACIPRLMALESLPIPDFNELPAWIIRALSGSFADFQKTSFDGRSLIAWPLVILLAPRRLLGLALLAVLGSGLTVQFSGLLSGVVRPALILVGPSPLDLLSAGALAAAIFHGNRRSEHGRLGHWAMLMGLALAAASIGFLYQEGLPNWGSVALLSAPAEFGAVNFILKIMATTMIASLSWRDLGGMMDGLGRARDH